jgi:osmotically-inducible protein OsmY
MTEQTARDLQTRAQDALSNSTLPVLREIRVEAGGQGLHLHGSVSSFYHKQMAQEVVRSVTGDVRLFNSIAVV